MDVRIRRVTPADEPFLWDMLYLATHLADAGIPSTAVRTDPALARYVEGWGRPHDEGVVALDPRTNERLGAAWMRLLTGDNRGAGYVDDATPEVALAVLPAHRRRGIAQKLLLALIDGPARSYPAISVSSLATNPALGMYRRLGFEPVAGSRTAIRPGVVVVTLTRTFNPPDRDAPA
jgi:ribosomal protein S18 acetylase RimI-like enzyme